MFSSLSKMDVLLKKRKSRIIGTKLRLPWYLVPNIYILSSKIIGTRVISLELLSHVPITSATSLVRCTKMVHPGDAVPL